MIQLERFSNLMTDNRAAVDASGTNFFNDYASETKYNGLLQQSPLKIARNRLFQLTSYMDTAVPQWYTLHEIITVWRFIQIIGATFAASYDNFWEDGSISKDAIGILSIIFHIIPPKNRPDGATITEFIYSALLIVFFILAVISASVYKKTAKLPKYLPPVISFFISTFLFLLHPVALNLCGEQISHLIMGDDMKYSIGVDIFAMILVAAVFFVSCWLYINVTSISFTFRPVSFMTILNGPSIYLFLLSNGITFLSAVASHLSKYPQIVLTLICAILNTGLVYSIYMPATFIRPYHNYLIFSASIGGGIHFIIVAIYLILDKNASQPQFFIIIALYIVTFIIGYIYLRKREMNKLLLLDSLIDNFTTEGVITSPGQMASLLCSGMSVAHQVCINWDLFNHSIEQWPDSTILWTLFGKFVSIYPEETNLLAYIIRNIINKNLKGAFAKESIMQASQIQMQRENSLSGDLKKKIAHVQKQVSATKRRLRNIWDLVIQSNINELEHAINNAYNSVNKATNEYIHLISLYPNNRFVARGYARYLNEILGDIPQYLEWQDKVRCLQRGISINNDIINQMGLHAFPMLPCHVGNMLQTNNGNDTSSFSTLNDTELEEETTQALSDQTSLISSRIDELKIPSIRYIRIISILLFVILMIAPTIGILIYATSYINSMTKPLEYMSYLSIIRSFNYQLPLWIHHYINENLIFDKSSTVTEPMYEKPKFTHIPETLGSSTDTKEQLKFLLTECSTICELLGNYRSYEKDNELISSVHTAIFEPITKYDHYLSINTSESRTTSLYLFYLDTIMQISSLAEEELSMEMFNSYKLLNPYLNANAFGGYISTALTTLTKFISDKSSNTAKIIRIIEIVVCIVFVILWVALLVFQLIQLKQNKLELYKCLIALPKNVVSSMSEAMRVLKKDENDPSRTAESDSDINKQEENLLKIFASAGDTSAGISSDMLVISAAYLLMMVIAVVCIVILCETFPNIDDTLTKNTPHLDDVMGTATYMVAIFLALNNAVIANTNGYDGMVQINQGIGGRPFRSSLERVSTRLETYLKYYHRARYGDSATDEPPFAGYADRITIATDILQCANVSEIYEDIHNTYSCFSVDIQILLFEPYVIKFVQPILDNVSDGRIQTKDPIFIELWILACNLYDTLFYPMFDGIVPQMKSLMDEAIPEARTPVVILLVIALIITIAILIQSYQSESKMKFSLKLLLHAQSKVVLQIPKISDVLSGDFSNKVKDTTQRNEIFFKNVVQQLPDAIIIANQQFEIESCNAAFERIFHIPPLEGDVREFFSSEAFSQDVTPILSDQQQKMNVSYQQGSTTAHLVINCGTANQRYIIIARDETQAVMYNMLIKEERSKSDALLASILPANLVKRVQDGEMNISFSVQSATVTFMDIVEFTPWCASNTAAVVMQSLNALYKEFDAALAMKPTMTKIKCIGDCYMAAGGIFSELNQPAIHSKEVVEFCLECIDAVRKVDAEINQPLRIRAGVSTGGPLVAGVLGTEKPTFEILGPCINMAQQMEHNGVPMVVHISRSTYELVYAGAFVIKERGQIQIKNGTVVTYLVESKK